VVREGQIAVVMLGADYARGAVGTSFSDPCFSTPTTLAPFDRCLLVVNAQFDARQGRPQMPFTLSSVPVFLKDAATPVPAATCLRSTGIGMEGSHEDRQHRGRERLVGFEVSQRSRQPTVTITATHADEAGHVAVELGSPVSATNSEVVVDPNVVILLTISMMSIGVRGSGKGPR
jgi:hypothetical protein